ncbi:MAG: hypothetical protein HUJ56_13425, partial [Erysipelotrichaceae bacterium]|nr:hypothetical protein [Erysipelotrichaceae bacterium]
MCLLCTTISPAYAQEFEDEGQPSEETNETVVDNDDSNQEVQDGIQPETKTIAEEMVEIIPENPLELTVELAEEGTEHSEEETKDTGTEGENEEFSEDTENTIVEEEGEYIFEETTYINPDYESFITEEDLLPMGEAFGFFAYGLDEFYSVDEVSEFIKENLKYRVDTFNFSYTLSIDEYSSFGGRILSALYDKAVDHTGIPNEGDYIHYNFSGFRAETTGLKYKDRVELTSKMTVTYYSDYDMEETVDYKVEDIINQLDLRNPDISDYQKIVKIYNYLCRTTKYDNVHNSSYKQKYSSYACLLDGTCVCQGYATAFYRLALEAGIDNRVIAGVGNGGNHAWNIVKVGDYYYNLDLTWDESCNKKTDWQFFLKSDNDFPLHVRGNKSNVNCQYDHTSKEWYETYPMGSTNYAEITCLKCGTNYVSLQYCPNCNAHNPTYEKSAFTLNDTISSNVFNGSYSAGNIININKYKLELNNNANSALLDNATNVNFIVEVTPCDNDTLSQVMKNEVDTLNKALQATEDNSRVYDISVNYLVDGTNIGKIYEMPYNKQIIIELD